MELSTEQITDIVAQLAQHLAAAGLVIVPAEAVFKKNDFEAKRADLLRRKEVSLVQAEKYKLIPLSRKTIKKMASEGDFMPHEVYQKNGRWYILTEAINNYNKLLYS